MENLNSYLPENAVSLAQSLLQNHPIPIQVVASRSSKHGDFRYHKFKKDYKITLNRELNKYQFLITLVHEMAHFVVLKKYKNVARPHGIEWKCEFRDLMLPFLNTSIFPEQLLATLANYLKNPKASTNSDFKLAYELGKYSPIEKGKIHLYKLDEGCIFIFRKNIYKKGLKRRTRFLCEEIVSKRAFLFSPNALVETEL